VPARERSKADLSVVRRQRLCGKEARDVPDLPKAPLILATIGSHDFPFLNHVLYIAVANQMTSINAHAIST
jgi:hypothetical protein